MFGESRPLLAYQSIIDSLPDSKKAHILNDLFLCLSQGRLVDCPNGWELTEAGDSVRPVRFMNADITPGASYPTWISLPDIFRHKGESLVPMFIRGEPVRETD